MAIKLNNTESRPSESMLHRQQTEQTLALEREDETRSVQLVAKCHQTRLATKSYTGPLRVISNERARLPSLNHQLHIKMDDIRAPHGCTSPPLAGCSVDLKPLHVSGWDMSQNKNPKYM